MWPIGTINQINAALAIEETDMPNNQTEAYRVTIEIVRPSEDKYPRAEEVYQQTVSHLDIQAVIAVVNGLKVDRELEGKKK